MLWTCWLVVVSNTIDHVSPWSVDLRITQCHGADWYVPTYRFPSPSSAKIEPTFVSRADMSMTVVPDKYPSADVYLYRYLPSLDATKRLFWLSGNKMRYGMLVMLLQMFVHVAPSSAESCIRDDVSFQMASFPFGNTARAFCPVFTVLSTI